MQELVYGIAIIPAIVGVIQAFKQFGMPKDWAPLAAIIIGIGMGFLILGTTIPAQSFLVGLGYGLGANGTYSVTKSTFKK